MERIKKYRISLLFFAATLIFAEAASLIPEPLRSSNACAAVCAGILFVLLWMAFWSCATVAKDTHPWVASFLKLFVVAQMLGAVAIAILIATGVMQFQPMIT